MGRWPTRLIETIGVRCSLRISWQGPCGASTIHNAWDYLCDVLEPNEGVTPNVGPRPEDVPADRWPTACSDCGAAVPVEPANVPCNCGVAGCVMRAPGAPSCVMRAPGAPSHQIFHTRLFRAPDGDVYDDRHLKVGDMYFTSWKHDSHVADEPRTVCAFDHWTNCDGRHLIVCTPDPGNVDRVVEWDVDSRANNCTLKDDGVHRCWVRVGVPGQTPVDVGKGGLTCAAGAGSIQTGCWHGFLHGGYLSEQG